MTSDEKLQHLQDLMAAFFSEARRRQKAAGLETTSTTRAMTTGRASNGQRVAASGPPSRLLRRAT